MVITEQNKLIILIESENPSLDLAGLQDAVETTIHMYQCLVRVCPDLIMMQAHKRMIDLMSNLSRLELKKKVEIKEL